MAEKQVEQFYAPPPKLGKWEAFSIFLWNPETHQFLGRTGASWAKILLFYVLFYTCLAGFFSAMLAIFYQTLDMRIPKRELDGSLIGDNPGLGFRPMPPESNVESTLIWYKGSDENNYKYWVEELDKFLEPYRKPGQSASIGQNIQTCSYDNEPADGKVCEVDVNDFAPCTEANNYNYPKSAPCIFLKLNKIFNWMPVFYNDTDLPEKMPQDLKVHIREEKLRNPRTINTVWVSCEGENPADVENIGPIQYIPRRGFPGYFFPFKNYEGYLSPLVAVFFERPVHGVLVNIECKAWAQNIVHDRIERRGSVHFELMVD
ncbi:sodium/potassium-transporting ATPase subunit beta-2 [Schistocerca americana]|uniref:sodium/potassium-transporting ATPase subunit beta-2 n=1 Tax=Schistocerca americana TaxID=7009 RepID=UPI001F4FF657|nr:sodium/potassium-transporting ATPase subunit beta-2 [Schistocerca americana]XP_049774469.1 sodium/potassium-transporting ATPase subunit beta-2 [Schistocerca cancellata]XP_049949582.1 sodium/potassium-transporting ATPase subunit beta-2 [Schistocerca serialis cubense]